MGKRNPHFQALTYRVEGKPYPRCILGSDRFLDWFPRKPPPNHLTLEYTSKMMRLAYKFGARGFDLSLRHNVIGAFRRLKDKHPDAVGIGNPNWLCGFKLGGKNLMEMKNEIVLTIFEKILSEDNREKAISIPRKYQRKRFFVSENCQTLTDRDIQNIYIDQDEWTNRITALSGLADFCLVGADYADWMCMFGRMDLLRWQIQTVRAAGMIPVSSGHWTSLSLPILDFEDYAAHWVLANKAWMYLDFDSAIAAIRKTRKPVTAFRILRGIRLPEDIEATAIWLKEALGVKSVVVGVDNPEQAAVTIPTVISAISSHMP